MSDARSWLAPCCALALAGCAGGPADQPRDTVHSSSTPARRLARKEVEAAVTKMLQGMIDDIGAIKHRYPELSEWDVRAPVKTPDGDGFSYSHNYSVVRKARGKLGRPKLELGEHACVLGIRVRFEAGLGRRQLVVTWFPNLGIVIDSGLRLGDEPSDGFGDEIRRIFGRHIGTLKELDRRAGRDEGETPAARREP